MPTEPQPVTLSEVVHKAVEVCAGEAESEALDSLLERFEDADQPISSVEDIDEVVAEAIGAISGGDPEADLQMAGAVIVYLAYRRDELGAEASELLRLAARAEFDGHPPPEIEQWLADRGVEGR
jgi:hypothetical protein